VEFLMVLWLWTGQIVEIHNIPTMHYCEEMGKAVDQHKVLHFVCVRDPVGRA
jgi:hypothetical protein